MKRACRLHGFYVGRRCPHCIRQLAPTAARGYGSLHQRARRALAETLPGPCGYGCGAWLEPETPWVAAHVVDGDAEAGWIASCRSCNERAKRKGRTG